MPNLLHCTLSLSSAYVLQSELTHIALFNSSSDLNLLVFLLTQLVYSEYRSLVHYADAGVTCVYALLCRGRYLNLGLVCTACVYMACCCVADVPVTVALLL